MARTNWKFINSMSPEQLVTFGNYVISGRLARIRYKIELFNKKDIGSRHYLKCLFLPYRKFLSNPGTFKPDYTTRGIIHSIRENRDWELIKILCDRLEEIGRKDLKELCEDSPINFFALWL